MRRGLISVASLAEQLVSRKDVRVVDATWFLPNSPFAAPAPYASGREAFEAGPRVPGAAFWDLDEHSDATTAPDTPHNLPDAAQFAAPRRPRRHRSASPGRVCYDQVGTFSSPRLWHTLRAYGFADVAVLDGGSRPGSRARGRPGARRRRAARRARPPTRSSPAPSGASATCGTGSPRTRRNGPSSWTPARPAGRRGLGAEPLPGCRSGHAPGAVNAPFLDFLEPNPSRADGGPGGPFRGATLKDDRGVAEAFAAAGVDPKSPCALSCGSGLTAAVVALALHRLEGNDAPIYDGAWCEYEADGDLPVVEGAA
ncbi:thiosulfate sulfurtransferase [Aureococcus anophagefferens]|uniref:Sulfurtransferase n=1 Tax=Aureococcus anophagefferens TaxID=44056 RepID=A0ABR1G947_AURAN